MSLGPAPPESHRAPAGRIFLAAVVLAACFAPAGVLTAQSDGAPAGGSPPDEGIVTWRLTWDNDAVVHSDNQFSNGWSLQVHGPPARSWERAGGTPAFGKAMARWFLPVHRDGLHFREGWSVGQAIQTPNDIGREDLIVGDVPYAAAFAAQNTWIAYDDRHLYGFGWLMGLIGPAARGEQVQKGFHKLIDSEEPMGWDNQLKNEPLLSFYYEQKRKLASSSFGDISTGMDAQLGNLVTAAGLRVDARFGWHLPRGFLYVPDPIGRHLSYDSHLPPKEPVNWTCYGSLSAGATVLGYTEFYDGNLFQDSHSIDHETVVETIVIGLHFQRWRWGLHLSLALSTDLVDPLVAGNEPDTTDNYGSLMIEFRH